MTSLDNFVSGQYNIIMDRTDIINLIANKINAQNYLEIGVRDGENFKNVICPFKLGVDPDLTSKALILQTSDFFFSLNKAKFDIVMVDGLHTHKQVLKDINNAIKFLNTNGWIIVHDVNPTEERLQTEEYIEGQWTGTCWKAFVELRMTRDDLAMCVVDTDFGCGLITRGRQNKVQVDGELNYQLLETRRSELLNLISVQQFIKMLNTAF